MKLNDTRAVLGLLTVLLALLPLAAHWSRNDNHKNRANASYGRNLLNTLEPNSIFMTEGGDNQVFATAYYQQADFLRPDVRVYDQKGNVFYRVYGDFRYMSQDEVDVKKDIVDWEIYSRGRPVYLTWDRKPDGPGVCGDWFLKRYGILFKVVPLKYRLLEDLFAEVEMDQERAFALIAAHYQPAAVMAKLRKNQQALRQWYVDYVFGRTQNQPHFISDEYKARFLKSVIAYRDWVEAAVARRIDREFARALVAELEKEGLLRQVGGRIVFVKDIPSPVSGDYWKHYKFEYRDVANALDWDYLTREILTNYNFYQAEWLRERLDALARRKAFFDRRARESAGETRRDAEKEAAALAAEIAALKKQELDAYAEAARYGYDMAAIHHNLGVLFQQRGDMKRSLEAFRAGAAADDLSWGTVYYWILAELREANNFDNPAAEKAVLERMRDECRGVYARLRGMKDVKDVTRHPLYNQFKQLEDGMINLRLKAPLAQAAQLRQAALAAGDKLEPWFTYVQYLYQRADYENIAAAWDLAPAGKRANPDFVLYHALAQLSLGAVDKALEICAGLKADFPLFPQGPFRIAHILDFYKRDPAKALVAYREFLAMDVELIKGKYPQQEPVYRQFADFARKRVEELTRAPK